LATAVGSIIGGLIIVPFGYSAIFIVGGTIILITGIYGRLAKK